MRAFVPYQLPFCSPDLFSLSLAFFTSLRTNLCLHDSPAQSSPLSTPTLRGKASFDLPLRQPSPLASAPAPRQAPSQDPCDYAHPPSPTTPCSVPQTRDWHLYRPVALAPPAANAGPTSLLTRRSSSPHEDLPDAPTPSASPAADGVQLPSDIAILSATADADLRSEALALLSASVASSQITTSVKSFLSHPLILAQLLFAILLARVLLPSLLHVLVASVTISVVVMGLSYWVASPYLKMADAIRDPSWLGDNDEVMVATAPSISRFGGIQRLPSSVWRGASSSSRGSWDAGGRKIVGVVVMTYRRTESGASGPSSSSRSGHRRGRHGGSTKVVGRAFIRGWAVANAYRGQHIGLELLRETVRSMLRRGVESIEVSPAHAFSERVMPTLFNALLERREKRVRQTLGAVVEEMRELVGSAKRRRRTNS